MSEKKYYVGHDGSGPYRGASGATGAYMIFSTEWEAQEAGLERKRRLEMVGNDILQFSNNVHERGAAQVTVRRGSKWARLEVGQEVALQALDDGAISFAEVLFVYKCRLMSIPEYMLEMEHDPGCRTFVGLVRELQFVYGEKIDVDEAVTVVGYRPK